MVTDRAVEAGHTVWLVDSITPPAMSDNQTEEEELKKGRGRGYTHPSACACGVSPIRHV